jgi:hypothetical protein
MPPLRGLYFDGGYFTVAVGFGSHAISETDPLRNEYTMECATGRHQQSVIPASFASEVR